MSSSSDATSLARYRSQIGRPRTEVITPSLLLDLGAARRNIEAMATEAARLGTRLRPHVKSHKSPQLARLQMEAGAIGVTCATVWEAAAMARAGIPDVLVANEIAEREKAMALAAVAQRCSVTIAVDDAYQIDLLADAAASAGSNVGVVVEVDIGMGRAGVRSLEEAGRLAERIEVAAALRFRGVHGYEGHCMTVQDARARNRAADAAGSILTAAARHLVELGHDCPIVTSGGTGTFRTAGANPGITDLQVGSYVLMDAFHEALVPDTFELALTVASTVTSRHGSTVVLDAGRKSLSVDFGTPPLVRLPGAVIRSCAEEHSIVELDESLPMRVGDRVEVATSYAPTAVNLHDVFLVLEDDTVADIWPVHPRGSGPSL